MRERERTGWDWVGFPEHGDWMGWDWMGFGFDGIWRAWIGLDGIGWGWVGGWGRMRWDGAIVYIKL